jgi:hypothetical protein
MSAQIIKLPTAATPRIPAEHPARTVAATVRQMPTETSRNARARRCRRDAWWCAQALTNYWRARMDFHSALNGAQRWGLADASSYPEVDGDEWTELVEKWRAAIVEQMLTPAPDQGAVAWKRAKLGAEQWKYTGAKRERLERAIEADVEWLAAHPTRKSIAAKRPARERSSPGPIEQPVLHDLAEK